MKQLSIFYSTKLSTVVGSDASLISNLNTTNSVSNQLFYQFAMATCALIQLISSWLYVEYIRSNNGTK